MTEKSALNRQQRIEEFRRLQAMYSHRLEDLQRRCHDLQEIYADVARIAQAKNARRNWLCKA